MAIRTSPQPSLRELIAAGPLFGTFLKLPRREVVEILALAGFDFAICDLEHAQITDEEAATVLLASAACSLPIVVRVPAFDVGLINRLLEAGAAGIQLPQVQRRTEVKAFRSAAKYPPQGSRSISLAQPAAQYGSQALNGYIRRANEEVLLIGQLETRELEGPIEELVQGLDVAFIGILDMTVDMGSPGQFDNPTVVERIREIETAAALAKVAMGIYADSPARASQAAAAGYRYIALSSDLGALSGSAKNWIKQLRESSAAKA